MMERGRIEGGGGRFRCVGAMEEGRGRLDGGGGGGGGAVASKESFQGDGAVLLLFRCWHGGHLPGREIGLPCALVAKHTT